MLSLRRGIFEQRIECKSRSHGKDTPALRVVWSHLCDEKELGEGTPHKPWSWQRQPWRRAGPWTLKFRVLIVPWWEGWWDEQREVRNLKRPVNRFLPLMEKKRSQANGRVWPRAPA